MARHYSDNFYVPARELQEQASLSKPDWGWIRYETARRLLNPPPSHRERLHLKYLLGMAQLAQVTTRDNALLAYSEREIALLNLEKALEEAQEYYKVDRDVVKIGMMAGTALVAAYANVHNMQERDRVLSAMQALAAITHDQQALDLYHSVFANLAAHPTAGQVA